MRERPPISTLFPYTTLFRSDIADDRTPVRVVEQIADRHRGAQVIAPSRARRTKQAAQPLIGHRAERRRCRAALRRLAGALLEGPKTDGLPDAQIDRKST